MNGEFEKVIGYSALFIAITLEFIFLFFFLQKKNKADYANSINKSPVQPNGNLELLLLSESEIKNSHISDSIQRFIISFSNTIEKNLNDKNHIKEIMNKTIIEFKDNQFSPDDNLKKINNLIELNNLSIESEKLIVVSAVMGSGGYKIIRKLLVEKKSLDKCDYSLLGKITALKILGKYNEALQIIDNRNSLEAIFNKYNPLSSYELNLIKNDIIFLLNENKKSI